MGRGTIKSIRTVYRSVWFDHPFLVGTVLFLVFLYRSHPFLFSLLVSASPILVCTFALLGALLSYGTPQFSQVETGDKIRCSEISSPSAVSLMNDVEAETFGTNDVFKEAGKVVLDRDLETASLLDDVNLAGKPKQDASESTFPSTSLLSTWQNPSEIVFEPRSAQQLKKSQYSNQDIELKEEIHWEELRFEDVASNDNDNTKDLHSNHKVQDRTSDTGNSVDGLVNGGMVEDNLESSWTPWPQIKVDNDGIGDEGSGGDDDDYDVDNDYDGSGDGEGGVDDSDDDDNDPSDSGSDGAESSSPDPSMADIIPMLDELHPLLENGNHTPTSLSRQGFGIAADRSHKLDESSFNSDEETVHRDAEEDGGGDDDDEEEYVQGGKEDEIKSAITWTEDDQKNLMDLGTSELERNQRLESLIARRRSRKNMRMTLERNLIDFDGMDMPPQIAPILTTRQNPFDSSNNSYDYLGLPPIPGSAPSVFSQRQNPFDLPYDSSEEKPDLMGDSFQQEFMELNQKEQPLFRRHESFNIGSSVFDFPRHAGCASRFRPYFIPERMDSEGYSSFTRQSSELSESSSFQRQFSGSSSFQRQTSGLSESSSFQRQSSDMSESKASSAAEIEPTSVDANEEEMKLNNHNFSEEKRAASEMIDFPGQIEQGQKSSDGPDSVSENEYEKRNIDRNASKINDEVKSYTSEGFHISERRQIAEIQLGQSSSEAGNLASPEGKTQEVHQVLEPVEKQDSGSSFSSLSEVNDDGREVNAGLENEELLAQLSFTPAIELDLDGLPTAADRSSDLHYQFISKAAEEKKNSSCSSSSSSSSEEYTYAEEDVEVDKELAKMPPRASGFYQRSENPSGWVQEMSNICPSSDIHDPVYDLSPQTSANRSSISSDFHLMEESDEKYSKEEKVEVERHYNVRERVYDLLADDQHLDSSDLSSSSKVERHTLDVKEHDSSQANSSSLGTEINEEPKLSSEVFLILEPALESVGQNPASNEKLSVAADSFVFHSQDNLHDKEQSIADGTLEVISFTDKLDQNIHVESNHSSDFHPETTEISGILSNKTKQKLVTNFSDESDPVEEIYSAEFPGSVVGKTNLQSELGGSVAYDKLVYEEISDLKEMDEAFFSELDAVGDFSLMDLQSTLGPNLNDAMGSIVDSDAAEQDSGELGKDPKTLQPTSVDADAPEQDSSEVGRDTTALQPTSVDSDAPEDSSEVGRDTMTLQPTSVDADAPEEDSSEVGRDTTALQPTSVDSDAHEEDSSEVERDTTTLQPTSVDADAPGEDSNEVGRDTTALPPTSFDVDAPEEDSSEVGRDTPTLQPTSIDADAPEEDSSEVGRDTTALQPTSVDSDAPEEDSSEVGRDTTTLQPTSVDADAPEEDSSEVGRDTTALQPTSVDSDGPEEDSSEVGRDTTTLQPTSVDADAPEEDSSEVGRDTTALHPTSVGSDVPEEDSSEIGRDTMTLQFTSVGCDVPEEDSSEVGRDTTALQSNSVG